MQFRAICKQFEGKMTETISAAEMRKVESLAIAAGQVTGAQLMERAGAAVIEAVFQEWPRLATGTHKSVVLCGPGNNGGDGFVVARLLAERGWNVEVVLLGDPGQMPPDARRNHDAWARIGPILAMGSIDGWAVMQKHPDLIVDAVFGTGLSRNVPWEFVMISQELNLYEMNAGREPIVAVDIPSGVNADTGEEMGEALASNLTVTFHKAKVGHHLGRGKTLSGKVVVRDIGL